MIPNRNVLWSRAVADELIRCGVRHVCLSPGSRSTPLALALHDAGLDITTHIDERSAAFFALGVAKATRMPAVLVCTSGTAAANYHPALVEAIQSQVPLLVLTADRPPELHDVGANQSIEQRDLFGAHAKWFVDVGLPQPTAARIRHLRALVCRAAAAARAVPAGPVHLNFPFQEPLEPTEVPGDVPDDWHKGDLTAAQGRAAGEPFVRTGPSSPAPAPAMVDAIARLVEGNRRGLLVAGRLDLDAAQRDAIRRFAERAGYPVLADPLSGLRFEDEGPGAIVTGYDAWLASARVRRDLRPELVLRIGGTPTSKSLLETLRGQDCPQVVVTPAYEQGEETGRAGHIVHADPAILLDAITQRITRPADAAWNQRLVALDETTRTTLAEQVPGRAFEGAVVAKIVQGLAPGSAVFASSSLPIRDLDRFGQRRDGGLQVFANRGASGIDGVLSTALGVAHGLGRRVTLLIGDTALLHDVGALATASRLSIPLDIVVLDNEGGGIFEFLPIAAHEPPFTALFVVPHGQDLVRIARAFGVEVEESTTAQARPLPAHAGGAAVRMLHVRSDRKANVRERRALEALVEERLLAARQVLDAR